MARNLVVCCDGTWNSPQQMDRGHNVPTNVVKMARAVREGEDQPLYYDTGVGTGRGLDRWTGGALGIGLTENIKQAYRWIAEKLQDGDRLFLFGFSRGAYTVRSLAGLIGRCGLTTADPAQVDRAYALYRKASSDAARQEAAQFKAQQRAVNIHFLGVWDTVGALGVPALSRYGLLRKTVRNLTDSTALAHGFHDETLGEHVIHAYHAVALDERRRPFEVSLWQGNGRARPNVEQVWFAGAHCNVGGGYCDSGLSDHAFMWMASKAMAAGLELDERYLAMRVDPNAHGEIRDEFGGAYRLIGVYTRHPGAAGTLNEKVHGSVFKRLAQPTNSYDPKNLDEGWAREHRTDDGLDLIETLRQRVWGGAPQRPPAGAAARIVRDQPELAESDR